MRTGKTDEPEFNRALARAMRQRRSYWRDTPDALACQRNGLVDGTSKQIDILVRSQDALPVAVETEWGSPALDDARERLGARVDNRPIRSAIAVGLPEEALAWNDQRTEQALSTPDEVRLKMVILYSSIRGDELEITRLLEGNGVGRWPESGHVTGTVDDLVRLCEYAAAPPVLVSSMAREVASKISAIATDLRGGLNPRIVEGIISELGQDDHEQGLKLACCIWLTALRLQNRLVNQSESLNAAGLRSFASVAEDTLGQGVTVHAIREEWRKILAVNYGTIFNVAVKSLSTDIPEDKASGALTALGELATEVSGALLGNRVDFAGELFPELLTDREETAAHYTLPVTAELLAGLAVDRLGVDDWSNTEELRRLRIADMACGTGALLRAVYGHIRHNNESTGGGISDLHKALMEDCLTGIDINPLAAHMTAAGLSSSGLDIEYERSNIAAVSVKGGGVGSLSLLVSGQLTNMMDKAKFDAAQTEDAATITVANESQDLVIQNPPYSRARADRKMFDVAGISEHERELSLDHLQSIRARRRRGGDEMIAGQAGLGTDFSALADMKLKQGGVFATVLPITAARAESWSGFRKTIERKYEDIIAIAFTGHRAGMMSADTKMGEMLLIANKRSGGESATVLSVNLSTPPRSPAEAFWYRHLISDAVRSERHTDTLSMDKKIGSWVRAVSPEPGFPWFAVGMRNDDLAAATARLMNGELYSPQERRGWSLGVPFTTLGGVAEIGPTHHLIGHVRGNDDIGAFAFDPVDLGDVPTHPALWAANATTQKRMVLSPTHGGKPHGDEGLVSSMLAKRGDLFISRTLSMISQALATARTSDPAMGGRAWTAIISDDDGVKAALTIWLNSTLGLMLRTSYAQNTQPGRATMNIKALPGFPVPDFGVATPAGEHARAVALDRIDDLAMLELRPISYAHADDNRKRIDEVSLDMVGLGGEPEASRALDFLRGIWCREPQVHGGNRAIMRSLGLDR